MVTTGKLIDHYYFVGEEKPCTKREEEIDRWDRKHEGKERRGRWMEGRYCIGLGLKWCHISIKVLKKIVFLWSLGVDSLLVIHYIIKYSTVPSHICNLTKVSPLLPTSVNKLNRAVEHDEFSERSGPYTVETWYAPCTMSRLGPSPTPEPGSADCVPPGLPAGSIWLQFYLYSIKWICHLLL